jgi:hypothetical protein
MKLILILIAFGALIRALQLFYLCLKTGNNNTFKLFDVYGDTSDSEKSKTKLAIEGLMALFCALWLLYYLF